MICRILASVLALSFTRNGLNLTAEGTPEPGTRASKDAEKAIISEFYAKYRKVANDQAPNVPTWCTFDSPVLVDQNILSHVELSKYKALNIFFENQGAVYSANLQEIRRYFSHREPWEDYDIYVFPPAMDWCIAFTHTQAYGKILVYVTGDTKKFS